LLDAYYAERGWYPKSGIPSKEKLVGLGLKDIAVDLEGRGILTSRG
jgi:aldehyde:ferredoxin oxidoreductase